jgi:serine protease AprX
MSRISAVGVRPGGGLLVMLLAILAGLVPVPARAATPVMGAEDAAGPRAGPPEETTEKIAPWLERELGATRNRIEMLVILGPEQDLRPARGIASRAERGRFVYDTLRASARAAQAPVEAWLASQGVAVKRHFWIIDALLIDGDRSLAHRLAARRDVARIVGNPVVVGLPAIDLVLDPGGPACRSMPGAWPGGAGGGSPAPQSLRPRTVASLAGPGASSDGPGALSGAAPSIGAGPAATESVEPGISVIHATDVWTTYDDHGEGIVVASMDTGVEWTHPAIQTKYRGWNNGVPVHAYSWHDSIHTGGGACGPDTVEPCDDHNHGTHTTGTMVGDDGGTNQIGVAPGARWVACRNMDQGDGTPARYLECMEWGLAPYPPGGDPMADGRPDLAPDITNNSWTCPPSEGCDAFTLQEAFETVRAAGQMTIAAAGNAGSSCSSVSDPPAIYDSVFTAGAISGSTLQLASFSSRGPVTSDGSNRLKPNIAAPGVSVRSSIRGGGYASFSGTSMASPHTAGAMALLWSARPQLRKLIRISRCYLERSAGPPAGTPASCGGTAPTDQPNNMWGWGLVDALAAIDLGPDSDADGIADACDCLPSDGGTFDAPPPVAGGTMAPDTQTYQWESLASLAGTGTTYDVVRGLVSELRSDEGFVSSSCFAEDNGPSFVVDTDLPPPGDALYYLVRGQNGCGSGSYGDQSNGPPRVVAVCN